MRTHLKSVRVEFDCQAFGALGYLRGVVCGIPGLRKTYGMVTVGAQFVTALRRSTVSAGTTLVYPMGTDHIQKTCLCLAFGECCVVVVVVFSWWGELF